MGRKPEQGLREAWSLLQRYGFQVGQAHPDALQRYLPFRSLSPPTRCTFAAAGHVESTPVELYHYEHYWTDSDGNSQGGAALLACVHHPWVAGGASITLDWKQWSTFAAVFDAVTWFPPFLLLKAVTAYNEARDPDRVVGHPEFDRLYYVHADSQEVAARTIPPALGEFLSRLAFRGTIELRPGLILFALESAGLDGDGVDRTLSYVRGLVGAYPPPQAHPMR